MIDVLKKFLITFIDACQESNSVPTLENEIEHKRAMIKYLVIKLDKYANASMNISEMIVYSFFMLICIGMLLFGDYDETNKLLITVILVPIIIEGMVQYKTDKSEKYNKICDIEMQLYEMCMFIKINGELEDNEKYILNFLKSKKKYTMKNEFNVIKAKGGK